MRSPVLALTLALLAACGAASSSGPSPERLAKMRPPLRAFHETLVPAWEAKAGALRVAKACDVAAELAERSKGVGDSSLASYAKALVAECEDPQRDEVESWLTRVHQRFEELARE
ncbi:MAG: hypothetical protein IPG50_09875 [Myxococcales bacterium]|nr:hypothetical protein [Myxococcales bacterium]